MRQLIALVQDGHVEYAHFDEDTDQLVQFARIMVPANFDLATAAVLGSNLIAVLDLNGRAKGKGIEPRPAKAIEAPRHVAPSRTPEANHAYYERTKARAAERKRESRAAAKRGDSPKPPGRPRGTAGARGPDYVGAEQVMAVINAHPEGVNANAITHEVYGSDDLTTAQRKQIQNRLAAMTKSPNPPFNIGQRNGGANGQMVKTYHPKGNS